MKHFVTFLSRKGTLLQIAEVTQKQLDVLKADKMFSFRPNSSVECPVDAEGCNSWIAQVQKVAA